MFINFTNHASSMWSDYQIQEAAKYGEIVDIPFPAVEPDWSKEMIQSTADKYIEDMDGNIKNIHVLDMAEDGKLLLPGKGYFDFKALLERVGDYSGKVMIEVYDGSFTRPEELIESYAWLKSELGK